MTLCRITVISGSRKFAGIHAFASVAAARAAMADQYPNASRIAVINLERKS
jgi:hypothetical protein